MSAFLKNRAVLTLAVLAGLGAASADAAIVIDYGAAGYGQGWRMGSRGMPAILMVPSVADSQAGYLMNRSRAWYRYGQGGGAAPLVVVPMTGVPEAASERQLRARNHVGRANAYRLHYFDR